jgi:hypothetical protein
MTGSRKDVPGAPTVTNAHQRRKAAASSPGLFDAKSIGLRKVDVFDRTLQMTAIGHMQQFSSL